MSHWGPGGAWAPDHVCGRSCHHGRPRGAERRPSAVRRQGLVKWQTTRRGRAEFCRGRLCRGHGGDIETKDKFRDFKLHVEFAPNDTGPESPRPGARQQRRVPPEPLRNPGPGFLRCRNSTPAIALVYSQKAPDKNMAKPPGEWQSYDIEFHAAKFEGGKRKPPPPA